MLPPTQRTPSPPLHMHTPRKDKPNYRPITEFGSKPRFLGMLSILQQVWIHGSSWSSDLKLERQGPYCLLPNISDIQWWNKDKIITVTPLLWKREELQQSLVPKAFKSSRAGFVKTLPWEWEKFIVEILDLLSGRILFFIVLHGSWLYHPEVSSLSFSSLTTLLGIEESMSSLEAAKLSKSIYFW